MGKTIVEAKEILESILQNYSQWHTDRAPSSSKKVNSIEETHDLSSKMDTILALLHKPSVENIPLQELVANNSESVDVNFVRNYGNNGYGNNNYNSYKPPYVPHTRPFVPYPNASDNKWKPLPPSDFDANKLLMEQVASHNTMIQELNKSVASISSDIKGLQLQAAGLDKALSKLADNQATLLSMSAGKPQASPVVGLNAITIAENVPLTFDENLNELLNYPEYLLPLMSHLASLKEEINETESYESQIGRAHV